MSLCSRECGYNILNVVVVTHFIHLLKYDIINVLYSACHGAFFILNRICLLVRYVFLFFRLLYYNNLHPAQNRDTRTLNHDTLSKMMLTQHECPIFYRLLSRSYLITSGTRLLVFVWDVFYFSPSTHCMKTFLLASECYTTPTHTWLS